MSFLLPADLEERSARELERACVAGGPDNMPWPTQVQVESGRLTVRRSVDESGCLVVPWHVNGAGQLMGTSGTLMERDQPYHFLVELARGKINQLRCQTADWQAAGLRMPAALTQQVHEASLGFSRAVTRSDGDEAGQEAQKALQIGYAAADKLVREYIGQMFSARHQNYPRLEATLGCRLGAVTLSNDITNSLAQACNSVHLTFTWKDVEPVESNYRWAPYDALLDYAENQGMMVHAGPLIDFSSDRLPDWLWLWEKDLPSIANFMCDYVETVVRRYRERIRSWQLTAASNCASVLALGEDELLWLTVRLVEAARQVDPKLDVAVGIAQPWGEYMALEDRTHSPFIFADTLVRSGLNLAALDVELIMGITPRVSYCRDLLETSRLIDLYSLLGMPLRFTLGYPSASSPDPLANQDYRVGAGNWHGDFAPAAQAEWAASFAALTLCKPSVKGVQWCHLADAQPHQFPHCGLFDAQGRAKPLLARLQELRDNHLR